MLNNSFTILYLILCSVFCTVIIAGNLIFQKFIDLEIFGYIFTLSAGVLVYPLTFLISDLVTELYGEAQAKLMVIIAIFCSLLIFILINIADALPAAKWSNIDDNIFHNVFNAYGFATLASIIANYLGQNTDIKIYAYLKKLTHGRHLWLRNNISTIIGQAVDTVTVILILSIATIIPFEEGLTITFNSLIFKIIAAICDTPLCYLGYYLTRNFSHYKYVK